jgi:hypothetical protein
MTKLNTNVTDDNAQKVIEKDIAKLHEIPTGKYKSGRVWKEKLSK